MINSASATTNKIRQSDVTMNNALSTSNLNPLFTVPQSTDKRNVETDLENFYKNQDHAN